MAKIIPGTDDLLLTDAHKREYVVALYEAFLSRQASDLEIDTWSARITSVSDLIGLLSVWKESDEFRAKLPTDIKLFVAPGHFYSPIVNPAEVVQQLAKTAVAPDFPKDIDLSDELQLQNWASFLPLLREIPFPAKKIAAFRYYFENFSYSYADGSILYAMIRHHQPKKIVEIGSGWSSACTLDTVENFVSHPCVVTFIEPYADLLRNTMGTASNTKLYECPVQDVPLTVFEELEANDILFIDSTHVAKTCSDVCFELFNILPRLKPGVIIHIHDVFWPFEYPTQWIVAENRSWNEIYMLRSFLTNNSSYEIMFFNDYFVHHHGDLITRDYPVFYKNTGGAFWLRKR